MSFVTMLQSWPSYHSVASSFSFAHAWRANSDQVFISVVP